MDEMPSLVRLADSGSERNAGHSPRNRDSFLAVNAVRDDLWQNPGFLAVPA